MNTGGKTTLLPLVTERAVHRRARLIVVGMFRRDVGVATDAGIGLVRGQFQFGRIHKQRDSLAGRVGLDEGLVPVTVKAIAVFDPGQRRRGHERQPQNHQIMRNLHVFSFGQLMTERSPCFANYAPFFEVGVRQNQLMVVKPG